jgi:lipid-A-disaccharide synthase-like uncharacterized protein
MNASLKTYRWLFVIGGFWNVLGTAFAFFAAHGWEFIERTLGMQPVRYFMFYDAWLALAFVFGLGYWLVAVDPHRNRDIALLGIVGKLLFSVAFVVHFVQGRAGTDVHPAVHPLFMAPVIGDLVFAVLFASFLRWERRTRLAGEGGG